jgi:hypothetical protein
MSYHDLEIEKHLRASMNKKRKKHVRASKGDKKLPRGSMINRQKHSNIQISKLQNIQTSKSIQAKTSNLESLKHPHASMT